MKSKRLSSVFKIPVSWNQSRIVLVAQQLGKLRKCRAHNSAQLKSWPSSKSRFGSSKKNRIRSRVPKKLEQVGFFISDGLQQWDFNRTSCLQKIVREQNRVGELVSKAASRPIGHGFDSNNAILISAMSVHF